MVSIIQDINSLQDVLSTPITLLGDDQGLLSPLQRGNHMGLTALPKTMPGIAVYSHYIKAKKLATKASFHLNCNVSPHFQVCGK